jgi:hypothetical protein
MRSAAVLCYVVLLALPSWATAQEVGAAPPSITLTPEAERVLRDYEAAWTARDPEKLALLFHPEGYVLSSGSPPVMGRAAIAQHYKGAGGPLHLRAIAYSAADTIAYIIGVYRHSSQVESGKFVLALRRSNPRQPWLIAADMDNTNSRERP